MQLRVRDCVQHVACNESTVAMTATTPRVSPHLVRHPQCKIGRTHRTQCTPRTHNCMRGCNPPLHCSLDGLTRCQAGRSASAQAALIASGASHDLCERAGTSTKDRSRQYRVPLRRSSGPSRCNCNRSMRASKGVVDAHTDILVKSTSTISRWASSPQREEEGDCDKQRQRKPSADCCIFKRRMRACMGVVGAHTEILTNSPITISRCASSPTPR